ncbi:hypothetical protein MNV49_001028 [Pseudohyphozyma bogoriensis]|nr:hypothetical protein MNV49_001028 [Pseudohyphozyma bogoriensis]
MAPKKAAFYAGPFLFLVSFQLLSIELTSEASKQVQGFPAAKHKKFPTHAQAAAWIAENDGSSFNAFAPPKPSTSSSTVDDARPQKRAKREPSPDRTPALPGREVWCDGSSLSNGQKGAAAGIGVFWGDGEDERRNLSERLPGVLQTNNRAEMYAVARILETDPDKTLPLIINTDSEYTINVFSRYLPKWRQNGWKTADNKPVLNQDLIHYITKLIALRMPPNSYALTANIKFRKVKAHVGIYGNEMADELAKKGAMMSEVGDVDWAERGRKLEIELEEKKGREGRGEKERLEEKVGYEVELEGAEEWVLSAEDMEKELEEAEGKV